MKRNLKKRTEEGETDEDLHHLGPEEDAEDEDEVEEVGHHGQLLSHNAV